MKREFPWGEVVRVHTVGGYSITEYLERGADNHPTHPRTLTGQTRFHVEAAHESYTTLDRALIGAICHKAEGPNGRAAYYLFSMIGI